MKELYTEVNCGSGKQLVFFCTVIIFFATETGEEFEVTLSLTCQSGIDKGKLIRIYKDRNF